MEDCTLRKYFSDKYPKDIKYDMLYDDETSYFPNTNEYLVFINDFRCLLNDRKISGWRMDRPEGPLCNTFNTPDDKNKQCSCNGPCNNIFWILHGLWETNLYPGTDCLPQQLLKDLKGILDNPNPPKNMKTLITKYTEIKKAEYLKIDGYDHKIKCIEGRNKNLNEINTKMIEEIKNFANKENIIKKVQLWLETNSGEINFKIGTELYDILTYG